MRATSIGSVDTTPVFDEMDEQVESRRAVPDVLETRDDDGHEVDKLEANVVALINCLEELLVKEISIKESLAPCEGDQHQGES
ncbi:unnamed protein product [Heligmosomoides polygyrus]|uniref:Uncharacterized protein n=1 Tax=Heligmosomoides polygyrus TaxID=6339 RepID=A0A183G0Q1_HELPZ|nr:unnamed protein product [Heligmosomoides polygyrus]